MCDHSDFHVDAQVTRQVGKRSIYAVNLIVKCTACGQLFKFLGVQPGLRANSPSASDDGSEVRLPIVPLEITES